MSGSGLVHTSNRNVPGSVSFATLASHRRNSKNSDLIPGLTTNLTSPPYIRPPRPSVCLRHLKPGGQRRSAAMPSASSTGGGAALGAPGVAVGGIHLCVESRYLTFRQLRLVAP